MELVVSEIKDQIYQLVESGKLDVPMLPKVAGSVITMVQDENSDMAQLANLIQQDQALASRLMKIANSPAYCGVNPLNSLQQAIARMGMNVIAEVALAASVGAKVFQVKGYESEVTYMWRHSLASSAWAKEIARILRRNVESAFMCGLLHQIGKPVVFQTIVDLIKENASDLKWEDVELLIQDLYIVVGVNIAEDWELPAMVIESIKYHHDYESASTASMEAMICSAANHMSTMLLSDMPMDIEKLMELDVMEKLNLYEDDLQKLVDMNGVIQTLVEAMSV